MARQGRAGPVGTHSPRAGWMPGEAKWTELG